MKNADEAVAHDKNLGKGERWGGVGLQYVSSICSPGRHARQRGAMKQAMAIAPTTTRRTVRLQLGNRRRTPSHESRHPNLSLGTELGILSDWDTRGKTALLVLFLLEALFLLTVRAGPSAPPTSWGTHGTALENQQRIMFVGYTEPAGTKSSASCIKPRAVSDGDAAARAPTPATTWSRYCCCFCWTSDPRAPRRPDKVEQISLTTPVCKTRKRIAPRP